jgi:manganese efflux pump family protein
MNAASFSSFSYSSHIRCDEQIRDKGGTAMDFSMPPWSQVITLSMIALALGMDAFSLGLGLGMKKLPLRNIAWLSVSVGIFHILMPLLGMVLGKLVSTLMKEIAVMVGGGILCFLGIHMLIYAWRRREEGTRFRVQSLLGVLLFSVSVSLDSFSVGLSLGLFAVDITLAVLLFGCAGTLLAGIGLYLGRFMGEWIGEYGEVVGGLILILLGSKFLW